MRNFRLPRAICLRAPFALAAFLGFDACQDSTTSTENEPVPVNRTVEYTENWQIPDSLSWGIGSAAQQKVESQTIGAGLITVGFTLPAPTKDTIYVGLWLGGMKYATLPFLEEGNTSTLTLKPVVYDTVAKALLKICSTKTDRNRDTLIARYARGLVEGTPGFRGFPGNCPVGMDTAAVLRMALAYAMGKGAPLQAMSSSWLLPLDTAQARSLVPDLVAKGMVSAKDVAKALPPYPVRLTNSVKLPANPIPGGAAAGVSGLFVWEAGRTVRPSIRVRTSDGFDSTNFHFLDSRTGQRIDTSRLIFPGDTAWDLSSALSIQVDSSARAGVDTLVVVVSDGDGHSATGKAVFRVTKPTAPKLVVTSSLDTSVPNSTRKVWVSASVTDSFGPDTVKIQSKTISGPPYGDSVLLEVGQNQVNVQACNQARLCASQTVKIVRAGAPGDTVAPVVGKLNAPRDTTVGYDTRTLDLSWSVIDDSALASVRLNGSILNSTTALYKTTVNLKVGRDTFVLVALDSHGNPQRDTVFAVRGADTTKPVIRRSVGTSDTTLPPSAPSIAVSWTVDDNALRTVTLDGTSLHGTSGIYSNNVTLSGKSVWIRILAVDSSGNMAKDSIFVELKDQQGPSIARISPATDTAVGNSTKSVQIHLLVKDVSGVDSVVIDGRRIDSASGGSYAAQLEFALYDQDKAVRATAWDRFGNRTDSVITFHRRDPVVVVAPRTNPVQPASRKGGTLASDVDSILVKWSVTSLLKLADTAVRIQGVLAARENDSVWSAKLQVPGTGLEYAISMVATDTSGRSSLDTVWVTRAVPAITLSASFDSTKGDPVLRQGVYATMSDSVRLAWKVDGTCQGCGFQIDGAKVDLTGGIAASGAKLAFGESSHELDVNVAGVVVAKSVVKIRRFGAMAVKVIDNDRDTVGLGDTTGTVVWSVTGAVSVGIDGASQNLSATGFYSKTLTGLRSGANPTVLTATDSLGRSVISSANVHKLLGADLLVVPPADSAWDSASYRISSVTPGAVLTWSTDSATWKAVPVNGTVAVYRSGQFYARASCFGYSTVVSRSAKRTVLHTNTAPAFRRLNKDTIKLFEDAAAARILWCDSASTGGVWDSAQKVQYILNPVGDAASYFEVKPAIDSVTGILTYKLAKDAFGTAKFRVLLKDNGGVGNSGVDSSKPEELLFVVAGVNDPKTFGVAGVTIDAKLGESTSFPEYAQYENPLGLAANGGGSGAWTEPDVAPAFRVVPVNDDAKNCFEQAPVINTGWGDWHVGGARYHTIDFKSGTGCGSVATFRIIMSDGGGTANGGVDTSSIPLTINLDNSFTTPDGKVYHRRKLGNRVWMFENLGGKTFTQSAAATACPSGWRLPTSQEWRDLVSWAGMTHLRAKGWIEEHSACSGLYGGCQVTSTEYSADNSTGFGLAPQWNDNIGSGSETWVLPAAAFWTSTTDEECVQFGGMMGGPGGDPSYNPSVYLGGGQAAIRCVQ